MSSVTINNNLLFLSLQLSEGDKTEIIKDLERQYQAKLDAIEAKVIDLITLHIYY